MAGNFMGKNLTYEFMGLEHQMSMTFFTEPSKRLTEPDAHRDRPDDF